MFSEIHKEYSYQDIVKKIRTISPYELEKSINKILAGIQLTEQEILCILSKSADPFLEELARFSKKITAERFGKTIQLYMPLYLSSECRSSCLYCGFSYENKMQRKTLTLDEIQRECKTIKKKGIDSLLLLTGEDYKNTSVEYIEKAVKLASEYFTSIGIEIYPLDSVDYKKMIRAGCDSLTLYQETYDSEKYSHYHIRGKKSDMEYRLNGPDRGGEAGFRKISLGVLLGLSDPVFDLFMLIHHGRYIQNKYWRTLVQFSLPRIQPSESGMAPAYTVSDRDFVRYIFILRLLFPDSPIALSTRESVRMRDNLMGLGPTTYSAESSTMPGGYSNSLEKSLEQFQTEDKRSVAEMASTIKSKDLDPVVLDFNKALRD